MPLSPTVVRDERGATDPILIIAGIAITLILLIGGSFAVAGFMNNARDLNAKGDLDRVATAQAAYMAENDTYGKLSVGGNIPAAQQNKELLDAKIGFTVSGDNPLVVRAEKTGWTAVTASESGKVFIRTSESSRISEVEGAYEPAPDSYGDPVVTRTNLATVPDASSWKPYAASGAGYNNSRWPGSGEYELVSNAADSPIPELDGYARWTAGPSALDNRAYGFALSSNPEATTPGSVNVMAVTPGDRLTISAYWRANNNTTAQFRIRFSDAGEWSTAQTVGANSARSNGNWVRVAHTFTVPANGTGLAINLLANGVSPGTVLESTGLLIEKASTVGTYFDGNTKSADPAVETAWVSVPGKSTSTYAVRPLITDNTRWTPSAHQPFDVALPPGILWADVANDLALVKR